MNIEKLKEWMAFAQGCGEGDYWDQLFEGKSESVSRRRPGKAELPPVDIYRSDAEITVVAELPGCRKEDVALSVFGNVLRLRAHPPAAAAAGTALQEERFAGAYDRQIQLPEPVDSAPVSANLTNGLLTIRFRSAGQAGKPILLD